MNTLYISFFCILLYSFALGLKAKHTFEEKKTASRTQMLFFLFAGLSIHALILYIHIMSHPQYVNLSIFNTSSLISWIILAIAYVSIIKQVTIDKSLLFILPLSILSIICNELLTDINHYRPRELFSPGLLAHIILSIFAYSTLTISCIQAVFLYLQENNLKSKNQTQIISWLPSIETTEKLLFSLIKFGLILLTLSIATGVFFIEDILAQKMSHKLVFSLISWGIFASLLTGKHLKGWRGITAIKWTIAGFITLMLAYFGSKFVLEVILS